MHLPETRDWQVSLCASDDVMNPVGLYSKVTMTALPLMKETHVCTRDVLPFLLLQ